MADGETGLIWPVLATAAGRHAAAAARQGWHGDELGLGQVELRYRGIGYKACACRSTGRYGGRR